MEKLQLIVSKIVNNSDLLNLLLNLNYRWQDEKEYEDFNEYIKVMKSEVLKIVPEVTFKTGYKRPIGFSINAENRNVKIFLKIKGNSANLSAELIK